MSSAPPGVGLANMRDRIEALGGTLALETAAPGVPGSDSVPSSRGRNVAARVDALPGLPVVMPSTRLARLAWLLAALTRCLEVVDTLITAAYRPLFSEETIAVHGWPFNTFAVVGSP